MSVSKIWVFAEADGDKPSATTLELLTKARELAETVEAVHVGTSADALAPGLGEHGATTVYSVDPGDALPGVVGAAALAALITEHAPDAVLFAQSYDGRDTIARLSAKLDKPVLTNGTDLKVDGDKLITGTAIFGGNTLVDTEFTGGGPFLAAIRPKSFTAEPSGGAAAAVVAVPAPDAGRAGEAKVLERHVEEREGPKLEEAAVVVSGRARPRQRRGVRAARRGAREAVERRVRHVARDRRRRLGAVLEAGRSDWQGREAQALYRARHLGCDAAHGGHEGLRQHHRGEQGRRGADLLHRRPRCGRRRAQGHPQADRSAQGPGLAGGAEGAHRRASAFGPTVPVPAPERPRLTPPDCPEVEHLARGIASTMSGPDGITELQRLVTEALFDAMTGHHVDLHEVQPVEPEEFAEGLADRDLAFRGRMLQVMLLGALIRHPLPPEVAARIAEFARSMSVDDGMLAVARRMASGQLGLAAFDFQRNGYTADWSPERSRSLHTSRELADAWDLSVDEPRGFSLLAMVVSLFETGYLRTGAGLFEAFRGQLSADGMAVRLADAMRRGALSRTAVTHDIDFLAIDWFDLAELPLDDTRGLFRIIPKSPASLAAGSVDGFSAGGISEFQDVHGREVAAAAGLADDSFGATLR